MLGLIIRRVLAVFVLAPVLAYAQTPASPSWKIGDMARTDDQGLKAQPESSRDPRNRNRTILKVRDVLLRVRLDGAVKPCGVTECFNLYYFRGHNFDVKNARRKNILFIPGGPGALGDGTMATVLEAECNVVYFDPRGSGLSRVPGPNSFDKFLRAKYIAGDDKDKSVVGDIEQIRLKELGQDKNGKPVKWDAIYGYSYGTLVAQQYAHAHPESVDKLILLAPVDRHNDTEDARTDQVLRNLGNIYDLIRFKDVNAECIIGDSQHIAENIKIIKATHKKSASPELKKSPIELDPGKLLPTVYCNDDFSFLEDTHIETIKSALKIIYGKLEQEYGSLNFLTLNYGKLKKDKTFKNRFPFPDVLFVALRQLQLLGAPQQDSNFYDNEIGDLVRLGMVVGYYSMFTDAKLHDLQRRNFPQCEINAPFLEGLPSAESKTKLCQRINRAIQDTKSRSADQIESLRDLYVLGVYDGIHRWLFRILKDKIKNTKECPEGGLTGKDLAEFSKGTEPVHKMLREESKRIGIVPEDPICPWDPGRFKHSVQTLFLKGGADAVIAGGQAEDFFKDGLVNSAGQGVVIEFPGMGHGPNIPFYPSPISDLTGESSEPTDYGKAYADLLLKFLSLPANQFRGNGGRQKA